jgi:hypothetical protein
MNGSSYNGMPGPGATTTQSFKEILASTDLQAKLPGGVLLKSGFGVVAKGRVLGKITTGGKYAPYASTVLTANAAQAATLLVVADSSAFIVGDTVLVGAEAAAIAITAIPDATHITLASGLVGAQNAPLTVKTNDGRQTAVCILDNDQDTTSGDVGASAFIAGIFDSAQILGADAAAKTALKLCYFA